MSSKNTQHLSGQSSKPSLSLCVCLCVNVHQLLSWDAAGCLSTEASPRNKMCFQSLQKEPLHDRGEEVNELPFVFHLTLKMLSQRVPRPWVEWGGRAYIFTTFALRLFFLAAVRWICSKRKTKTVKWKKKLVSLPEGSHHPRSRQVSIILSATERHLTLRNTLLYNINLVKKQNMLMTYGDKWKHLRDLQVVEDKFDFFKLYFTVI